MTAPTQASGRSLSPAEILALIALIEAQAKVRAQLTAAASSAAVAAFRTLGPGDWWDSGKVDRAIQAALRVIQPSQRQAARITDAYLTRAVSTMTGRRVSPAGSVEVTKLRRAIPAQVVEALAAGRARPGYVVLGEHDPDHRRVIAADSIDDPLHLAVPDPHSRRAGFIDPAEAYGRVADAFRYQVVAEGVTEAVAQQRALIRVAAVAETDVTLAVREQYRKSLGKLPGVTGWRRILHPELSETGPCGLCVVAADRIYKKEDLQPIHGDCKCEVLPVIGALDPGIRLNSDDLNAIYDAAGGTGGDVIKKGKRHSGALKRVRVALVEHGELGPYLTDADQTFRGPAQVAKTKSTDPVTRTRAHLESLEESFARLTRRALAGEDVDRPLKWQTDRIEAAQHKLAALV